MIKFRGKRLDNGKFVYGDLIQNVGQFRIGNAFRYDLVYPDSVVQFIGYDEQGREIYEGDEIADPLNGEIYTAKLQAQVLGEDVPAKNFIDNFYVLKAIKADVLFSAPNLSNEEFQKMFGELITVQGWFKFGDNPMFEVFQIGRNVSICGIFTHKSFGYLQQVLDEYGIEGIVNRVGIENRRFAKLTDIADENSTEEWGNLKCLWFAVPTEIQSQ